MSELPAIRLNALTLFAARMADIRISRHPLRSDCFFMVNKTEFDIYQDGTSFEVARIFKQVIVKKNPDMFYVQESFGDDALVEDGDLIPWVVNMTCLGLPRLPMLDDRFLIDGMVYSVSAVKPVNRNSQGILECLVYPERRDDHDTLCVYGVSFHQAMKSVSLQDAYGTPSVMRVIYGGSPVSMSWDKKSWSSFEAVSTVTVPRGIKRFYVKDARGVVSDFVFGGRPVPSSTPAAPDGYSAVRDCSGRLFFCASCQHMYVNG